MKIKYALTASAAAALLTLTGCSSTGEAAPRVTDTPSSGASSAVDCTDPNITMADYTANCSDPAAGEGEYVEEETAAPTETQASVLAFGQTSTWTDSATGTTPAVEMTVAPGVEYDSDSYDATGTYQKYTITVNNVGTNVFDPSLISATASSANVEAEQLFDSGGGITGAPSTSILPGASVSFDLVFDVTDPASVVFESSPGFEYQSIIWTNRV